MTDPIDRVLAGKALETEMLSNPAGAQTVREYLTDLLYELWTETDRFDSQAPWGYRNWKHDLFRPLIDAGLIPGELDEQGRLVSVDEGAGDRLVRAAIGELDERAAGF
jgi:hypothetical protein